MRTQVQARASVLKGPVWKIKSSVNFQVPGLALLCGVFALELAPCAAGGAHAQVILGEGAEAGTPRLIMLDFTQNVAACVRRAILAIAHSFLLLSRVQLTV